MRRDRAAQRGVGRHAGWNHLLARQAELRLPRPAQVENAILLVRDGGTGPAGDDVTLGLHDVASQPCHAPNRRGLTPPAAARRGLTWCGYEASSPPGPQPSPLGDEDAFGRDGARRPDTRERSQMRSRRCVTTATPAGEWLGGDDSVHGSRLRESDPMGLRLSTESNRMMDQATVDSPGAVPLSYRWR